MTRKIETLAYNISNNAERKASYEKMKKELIEEVSELSTVCGVDACVIIYSEYDAEPEVWPSHIEAQAILARFQRIEKAEDQLRRLKNENRCLELVSYVHECVEGKRTFDDTRFSDAAEMNMVTNQILRELEDRTNAIKAESQRRQALLSPASVAKL